MTDPLEVLHRALIDGAPWVNGGDPDFTEWDAVLVPLLAARSTDEHPPYPLPADFETMTDAEFWGYAERIGFSDRIRHTMAIAAVEGAIWRHLHDREQEKHSLSAFSACSHYACRAARAALAETDR